MANQVVYGIVANRQKAEHIIQSLVDAGLDRNDISFLVSQKGEFKEFSSTAMTGTEANRNWRTEERLTDYPAGTLPEERYQSTTNTQHPQSNRNQGQGGLGTEKHTKAPEGTATGATAGGIIGGTLGLLAGIGALAIPGMGPFIAAGPLMAALSGLGAGGTIGGIIGALVGAGIPEYEAKRYENRLKEGGILLAIRANTDALAKKAKDLMQKSGAEDVSISSEATTSKNYKK
ncbi:hypothetical protein [Candidatus Protochlamydia phocaeensis]|uniref:hypothetical protein n=1 Tax=Candidatus Protochlamydia phocaeensis TaxID=1414722 RepID=UPI000837CEF2|nr:hypothetical protein [Candidatus Protochlamydia phocaeensis]